MLFRWTLRGLIFLYFLGVLALPSSACLLGMDSFLFYMPIALHFHALIMWATLLIIWRHSPRPYRYPDSLWMGGVLAVFHPAVMSRGLMDTFWIGVGISGILFGMVVVAYLHYRKWKKAVPNGN